MSVQPAHRLNRPVCPTGKPHTSQTAVDDQYWSHPLDYWSHPLDVDEQYWSSTCIGHILGHPLDDLDDQYRPHPLDDLYISHPVDDLPARSLTSPPSWYLYQPGEEVDNSSVRTSTSLPGWYGEQLGMQVSLLAGLVPVPAQGVGQPTRWTGTGTSLASRLAYFLGGYLNLAIREPTTSH
ncbi:hypothetical protein PCANC_20248 [Puccinia coronata f. sp. avenae]|uniref:Uncharacterized protein n=1 Tax=Puccinia coronata f. sp. avenae TaxID=200324 RepID=A0A2N5SH84_9BASI|nr:hypothetical protein PCANC_20248 [Puccinia coronata f. sp. avenae]